MSYDIEKYAEALEELAEQPGIRPPQPNDNLFEYAQRMTWERGYQHGLECARKQAAEMLRMKPETLWVVYPGHFPNPEEGDDD